MKRVLIMAAMMWGIMYAAVTPVYASEYQFDLNDFYVSEEFLEKGTSVLISENMSQGVEGGEATDDKEQFDSVGSEESVAPFSKTGFMAQADEELPEESDVSNSFGYSVGAMKTGSEGVAMIERWEGCRLTAYKALSTEKYYTIGYGHYGPDVTAGMTITQAQAEALLKQDLQSRETYLNNFLISNNILMAQNEFDAIISLIYNIGTGNFSTSTIRRYILEGFDAHTDADYTYAISMWHYSGGKSIQGLVNRRAAESALFVRYGVKRSEVKEISLDVKGKIGLNIYIDIPTGITGTNGAYARVTTGNSTSNVYLSNMDHSGQRYRVVGDFAAKDMGNSVTVNLYDASGVKLPLKGSNTTDGYTYASSIGSYASNSTVSSNSSLSTLVNAMTEYGRCAKAYFEDSGYAGSSQVNSVPNGAFVSCSRTITGELTGLKYVGTTLLLKSDTTIRHYFTVSGGKNINNYTFSISSEGGLSGATMNVGSDDGLYFVEIRNISPVDYDRMYSVCAQYSGGASSDNMTIKYGVFSYAQRVMEVSDSQPLKRVMNSMYLYNKAAEGYF